jgi:hypothetical protein
MANPWAQLELLTGSLAEHGGGSVAEMLRSGRVVEALDVIAGYGEHAA